MGLGNGLDLGVKGKIPHSLFLLTALVKINWQVSLAVYKLCLRYLWRHRENCSGSFVFTDPALGGKVWFLVEVVGRGVGVWRKGEKREGLGKRKRARERGDERGLAAAVQGIKTFNNRLGRGARSSSQKAKSNSWREQHRRL